MSELSDGKRNPFNRARCLRPGEGVVLPRAVAETEAGLGGSLEVKPLDPRIVPNQTGQGSR